MPSTYTYAARALEYYEACNMLSLLIPCIFFPLGHLYRIQFICLLFQLPCWPPAFEWRDKLTNMSKFYLQHESYLGGSDKLQDNQEGSYTENPVSINRAKPKINPTNRYWKRLK